VLNDAVLWLDASLSSVSGGKLTNLGKGGSALDAQFGSTTSTDTNDPLLLSHTGTNYLYLPGVVGNLASTASTTNIQLTGDRTMIVDVAMDDYTPTQYQYFLSKRGGATGEYFFRIDFVTSGRLQLLWYESSTQKFAQSTDAISTSDGTRVQIAVTHDVDNGAGGNDVRFFTRATSSDSWAQLGSTVTNAGIAAPTPTANGLAIGSQDGSLLTASGKFYRATLANGIGASGVPGGTTVFDADFTTGITSGAQATFTESSANAATVTINRATSGRKSVAVTRNVLLFGTDDYLEIADNDLLDFSASESFTALVVVRQWSTRTAYGYLNHNTGGSPIQGFGVGPTRALIIGDGVVQPVTSIDAPVDGALTVFGGVRNVPLDQLIPYRNNTVIGVSTDTTTGTISSTGSLVIGKDGGSASYQDFEFVAAAVFRRVLTTNEIATIVARYT
jgi:hypothetical protein